MPNIPKLYANCTSYGTSRLVRVRFALVCICYTCMTSLGMAWSPRWVKLPVNVTPSKVSLRLHARIMVAGVCTRCDACGNRLTRWLRMNHVNGFPNATQLAGPRAPLTSVPLPCRDLTPPSPRTPNLPSTPLAHVHGHLNPARSTPQGDGVHAECRWHRANLLPAGLYIVTRRQSSFMISPVPCHSLFFPCFLLLFKA